jgi:hypothetical protein
MRKILVLLRFAISPLSVVGDGESNGGGVCHPLLPWLYPADLTKHLLNFKAVGSVGDLL